MPIIFFNYDAALNFFRSIVFQISFFFLEKFKKSYKTAHPRSRTADPVDGLS